MIGPYVHPSESSPTGAVIDHQPRAQGVRRTNIVRYLAAAALLVAAIATILIGQSRVPNPGEPISDPAHTQPIRGTCVDDLGRQIPFGSRMVRAQVNTDPTFNDCRTSHVGEVIAVAVDVSRTDIESNTVCNYSPNEYTGGSGVWYPLWAPTVIIVTPLGFSPAEVTAAWVACVLVPNDAAPPTIYEGSVHLTFATGDWPRNLDGCLDTQDLSPRLGTCDRDSLTAYGMASVDSATATDLLQSCRELVTERAETGMAARSARLVPVKVHDVDRVICAV